MTYLSVVYLLKKRFVMAKEELKKQALRFENGFLVTPGGVLRSEMTLRDGRVDLSASKAGDEDVINIEGKYVVPGFIDIHFHGYNLFEFTAGLYDPKTETFDNSWPAYENGFDRLRKTVAGFGVTDFYVATWATEIKNLKTCYGYLHKYLNMNKENIKGAKLLGGLLEGSFINPQMAGAQNPDFVLEQTREKFDAIEDKGAIKLVNAVADFGRQSCELIEYLTSKGIVVGAGHTDATCEQMKDAVKAGLKYFIHFTNGPTGGSFKPFNGGGAIEAVLKYDELYAELILDGYHVNPAYVRDILKRKGADRIIAVTDSLFVTGSALKNFEVSGIPGQVSDDGGYICVVGKPNTLCSSNLTMNRAFRNLLNWLTSEMEGIWNRSHNAMDFEQALVDVSKICSTNTAVLTALAGQGLGSITDGAQADLCVLDITGSAGNYSVEVDKTIVDGNIVYSKE